MLLGFSFQHCWGGRLTADALLHPHARNVLNMSLLLSSPGYWQSPACSPRCRVVLNVTTISLDLLLCRRALSAVWKPTVGSEQIVIFKKIRIVFRVLDTAWKPDLG